VNKTVGHDNVPAYFIKIAVTTVAPYLQCCIDFSYLHGIFPQNSTLAKVIPLHKKGDKTDPNNFHPITIVTCFSKNFERLIYNRFYEFLKKHSVIHESQYGFQTCVNYSHAILDIVTTAFENIDQNLYTGLIFLELQKAFDTVSHDILLAKPEHYRIRGSANLLMKSFLTRKQYTSISGFNSDTKEIAYGVAQGSTLGPCFSYYTFMTCQIRLIAFQGYTQTIHALSLLVITAQSWKPE